jgi:hypothetical protein
MFLFGCVGDGQEDLKLDRVSRSSFFRPENFLLKLLETSGVDRLDLPTVVKLMLLT